MRQPGLTINLKKVAHETLDGEVIVINLVTGAYYHLTGNSVPIWSAIEQNVGPEEIVRQARERFPGDPADLEDRIRTFFEGLVAEEIVIPADGESGPPAALLLPFQGAELGPLDLAKYTNMSDLLLLDPLHDVDDEGWPTQRPQ